MRYNHDRSNCLLGRQCLRTEFTPFVKSHYPGFRHRSLTKGWPWLLLLGWSGCKNPQEAVPPLRPSTVVMLVTPKIFNDFDHPESRARELFTHYRPLTAKAARVIVILAIGGGDHILRYRGKDYWSD